MKKINLILLLSIIFSSASSQVINVESSRMQSDTVGWKGGIGAAVSLTQNTEKIFQLNLEAQLQYKTSKDRGIWLILGNLGLLKIGTDRFVSDDLLHLRYNRKVNEWLRWEVFGQYQNNEKERTTPIIKHNDFRNSSYVSFTWLPRDNIEMISTTYFQPLLKKLSDFRILNQIAFAVKATPHLGLEVKWNYLHDRFPAGNAPRTTYMFATGLRYDL